MKTVSNEFVSLGLANRVNQGEGGCLRLFTAWPNPSYMDSPYKPRE
jgi:hypothetical protein